MRHLRAISDSPVHLTRESNDALLIRVGVDCPLYTLSQEAARRHRCTSQQEAFQLQPPGLCEIWERVLASFGQQQLANPSDSTGPLGPDPNREAATPEPNSATACLASAPHAPVNASVVSAATPPSAAPANAIDAGTSSSMSPAFATDRPASDLNLLLLLCLWSRIYLTPCHHGTHPTQDQGLPCPHYQEPPVRLMLTSAVLSATMWLATRSLLGIT